MAAVAVSTAVAVEDIGSMKSQFFALILVAAVSPVFAQKIPQKSFDSPEAATQALIDAASNNDTANLMLILGSKAQGILTTGQADQDKTEREEFARLATNKHHLERSSMNSQVMILVIGDQGWPFPIPVVQNGRTWHFDCDLGAVELRARQLGANELDAIEACAGYVSAQESYAMRKRSPAGTLEFAQDIASSSVPKEFADAAVQSSTHPYHGYYFRILKEQGPNAPGGQHPYVIGKSMIGGFALVAWPAQYGITGIHSFIVNQDGVVYEKDRGPRPATPVTRYDPDPSWTPVD